MTLEPGTIYATFDQAIAAAACLCGLHPDGATVYSTTDELVTAAASDACLSSGEAYIVATAAVQRGGATWDIPPAPYVPVYTIIRRKP